MNSPQPLFIDSAAGRIFALYFAPQNTPRGAVLYLPPLAEEMNRCRALAAAQARLLANAGYACLLFDYFGTGDSSGELSDANWDIWHGDVLAAAHWLEDKKLCHHHYHERRPALQTRPSLKAFCSH